MRAITVLLLLAVAGCQATKPIAAMSYGELKTLANEIGNRCVAQGVKPGTRDFEVCFRQESNREAYNREMTRRQIRAIGRGLQAAGAASQPVTCTTSHFKRMSTTTCN